MGWLKRKEYLRLGNGESFSGKKEHRKKNKKKGSCTPDLGGGESSKTPEGGKKEVFSTLTRV